MKKSAPFISVVVCCYNGADVLPDALRALFAQKYDGHKEVIVVDDGSSDDTYRVAKAFKDIRVIRCEENQGLAGARNVGIAHAKGEIIAFTDDDCRPLPTWLKELAAAYDDPGVNGVGGSVISAKPDNLVLRYLDESKPLKPLESNLGVSKKLTYRFGLYVKGLVGLAPKTKNHRRTVYSLVGANMSFRKKVLEDIGLFDTHFRFGGEEEDVCKRINEADPGSLLFTPNARVKHKYERTLKDALRRSKAYAKGNARMYHKHSDIRPIIFPFPILIVLSALLGLITPYLYLTPIVLVPLIYFRWTALAIGKRRPEALTYGYIQMLQECWANVGFINGVYVFRNLYKAQTDGNNEKHDLKWVMNKTNFTGLVLALLLVFNLVELNTSVVQAAIASLYLLLFPGYLLLVALRARLGGAKGFVLAMSGSVSLLILLGLTLNTIDGLFSKHPHYSHALFMSGFNILILSLGLFARLRKSPIRYVIRPPHFRRFHHILGYIYLALLPALGVIASDSLNRSNINILSMITLAMIGATLLWAVARFNQLRGVAIGLILYSVSFTLILMGSSRGVFLSGTDTSREFYIFELTKHIGHWTPSLYSSAYNACLSINLLPILIQSITKVSDQAVFRILIPSFYALMPLGVFVFLRDRQKTSKLVAFVAALFFLVQPVYMTWSAVPIRQMVCLPLFAALVIAIFTKQELSRVTRAALIVLFGTGMVLSHYSTTYLALGLIICGYLVNRLMYVIDVHVRHKDGGVKPPVLSLSLIVILCIISWVWLTPITHASNNITHLMDNGITQLREGHFNIFKSNQHASQSTFLDQFTISPKHSTATQIINGYINESSVKYKKVGIDPIGRKQPVAELAPASPARTPYHVTATLASGILLIGQVLSKLSHLFMAIGLIAVAVSIWKRRKPNYEYGVYSLSAALVLVLVAVVPYASISYDLGRTIQQMLVFLALPTITGGLLCVRMISLGRISSQTASYLLGAGVVLYFFFTVGWVSQLTGGAPPSSLLNNYGSQYGAVIQPGEVDASQWLSTVHEPRTRIYAGYYARNRLWLGGNNQPVNYNELFPWTVDRSAYVYQDKLEIETGRTVAYYNGSFVTYRYPTQTLVQTKNVIYSNGNATIYK